MVQKIKCKTKLKNIRGSVLVLVIILLFVVLSVVVSLTYITVLEQKMSSKTKSSVGAFFNAESGIEWALNKIANSSGDINSVFGTSTPGNGINCPNFGSGSLCKVYLLDSDGKVITTNQDIANIKAIRVVGNQGEEAIRAIEVAVAAGGKLECISAYRQSGTYVARRSPSGMTNQSSSDPVLGESDGVRVITNGEDPFSDNYRWGIQCVTENGWKKTGCHANILPGDRMVDLRPSSDSCVTDNEEWNLGSWVSIVCCK